MGARPQAGWREPSSTHLASLASFSSFTLETFGFRSTRKLNAKRSNMFGFQGPQLVLISPPRPWYGRPVRPTIKPPRALLSGKLDLEVIAN